MYDGYGCVSIPISTRLATSYATQIYSSFVTMWITTLYNGNIGLAMSLTNSAIAPAVRIRWASSDFPTLGTTISSAAGIESTTSVSPSPSSSVTGAQSTTSVGHNSSSSTTLLNTATLVDQTSNSLATTRDNSVPIDSTSASSVVTPKSTLSVELSYTSLTTVPE